MKAPISLSDLLERGIALAVPEPEAPPTVRRAPVPEKFRGITLDTLAGLLGPNGAPALGGVVGANGAVLHGAEAVAELRDRTAGALRVVLIGETHAGKTVAACAILQEAAAQGAERPRFVRESDLRDPEVFALARSADVLVLDNLGWALDGAPGESALAAQKRGPTCDLLDRLSTRRRNSFRLIVTTWLDEKSMARAYTGGVVPRVYEGAELVKIVRPETR